MNHNFFDGFKEEFEDELQALLEFDSQEFNPTFNNTSCFNGVSTN